MSVNIEVASQRVFQEYKTEFLKSLDASPRIAPEYAVEVPSSSRSTLHAWFLDQSSVKEWLGRRKLQHFGTVHWEVVNRNWELTYEFEANQVADDLSGLAGQAVMRARNNAAKWARHEDLLCAQTLEAGVSANCYDGQYFFDTDHPTDPTGFTSGTFSNVVTGALTHGNLYTALIRMASFKNPDGSPMVPPGGRYKLMYPPALLGAVDAILNVRMLAPATAFGLFGTAGMSENPLYGRLTPIQNSFLTDNAAWYVIAESDGIKPIIFQRRQAVETMEQGPGSPIYFYEKKFQIGSDARYEASFTLPQLAVRGAP